MLNFQQHVGAVLRGRAFLVVVETVLQIFFDLFVRGLFAKHNIAQYCADQTAHDKKDHAECAGKAHPQEEAEEQEAEGDEKSVDVGHVITF